MNQKEPSLSLKHLLADPYFRRRLFYIRGSPLNAQSLAMCKAGLHVCLLVCRLKYVVLLSKINQKEYSDGIMILDAATLQSADSIDASTIMQAIAIKQYAPRIPIYCKIRKPTNVFHLQQFQCYCILLLFDTLQFF